MAVFCYQKVAPPLRLGEKIKKAREDKGLSLVFLSEKTRVPVKYLTAIEDGAYCSLPKARAHRVAYLKEVSDALSLPQKECLTEFEKEAGFKNAETAHPRQSIKIFPFTSISIFLRNVFIAGLVLAFAGYLAWQVKGILQPPFLAVFSPTEGFVLQTARATVTGQTEKETSLTINGKEIMADEKGNFSADIDLSTGLNTIQISATKKHGKTTTVVRHIVVQSAEVGVK